MTRRFSSAMSLVFLLIYSCQSQDPLVIGLVGPLTGPAAEIGIGSRNAFLLLADALNAKGGINGRRVELAALDDYNTPEGALKAFEELHSRGIRIVFGSMISGASNLAIPFANDHGILVLSGTIASDVWTGRDDWFLRTVMSNSQIGKGMALAILQPASLKKVVLIHDEGNNLFAESLLSALVKELEAFGGQVLHRFSYSRTKPLSYDDFWNVLSLNGAEAVVAVSSPLDSVGIAQFLYSKDWKGALVVSSWSMTPEFLSQGGEAAEGTRGAAIIDLRGEAESYKDFVCRYRERFQTEPSFASAQAYEAIAYLFESIKRAGTDDPIFVKNNLLNPGWFDGLTGRVEMNKEGDVERSLYYFEVKNGAFERLVP